MTTTPRSSGINRPSRPTDRARAALAEILAVEVTITATSHTDCEACDSSAEAARDYVATGGRRLTAGKFASSQVDGGPHWASFTTEPAPALAEAASQS